jgi:hypothetical protein
MANMKTVAELLAFRKLEEETRSGVPHFKMGQHKARLVGDMAQLSYVDIGGHLVVLILHKRDGEWALASPTGIRAGQYYIELVPFPRYFKLTDLMVRCLQKAEAERQSKKKGATNKKSVTPSDDG